MSQSWVVHPHGPLRRMDERLWIVSGSLPRLPFPRNMLLYQQAPGKLLVWSAVALEESAMAEVEEIGEPTVIVVPNRHHRQQARAWQERYPKAITACPLAARPSLQPDVRIDKDVETLLPELDIICHAPVGIEDAEVIYEFPLSKGKALAFVDLLFNLEHGSGLKGLLLRLLGSTGGLKVTRIARRMLVENKRSAAEWLERTAERDDLEMLLVGHGEPVTEDCAALLSEAAGRLR